MAGLLPGLLKTNRRGEHMKSLLLSLALLVSSNVYADDLNRQCRMAYNEAYDELKDRSEQFNEGDLSRGEFAALVVGITTELGAVRVTCRVFEDPDNRSCVDAYKERFWRLRDQIKVAAVLSGNQTEVDMSIVREIASDFENVIHRLRCGDLD